MKKLLIKESPLLILPSLAMKIGFREAAVLQQIHFWLTTSSHHIEGRKWIYNTYKDWQKQFPFWSESTIKRTILFLEEQKLLMTGNWNFSKMDKTKWYTIDYEKVEQLGLPIFESCNVPTVSCPAQPASNAELTGPFPVQMGTIQSRTVQIDSTIVPDAPSNSSQSSMEETDQTQAIPESSSKKSSEKEKPIAEIIAYLNQKTQASYKPSTDKTKKVIISRLNEGFTVTDFKQVIDRKTDEWLSDPCWSKYLRPETLFGTKFESYLNQKVFKKAAKEDFNFDD